MPLFDTHTHIYLSEKKSEDEIIAEIMWDKDLIYIATIGLDKDVNFHNIELSKKHSCIIPTIWIHPCYVEKYKDNKDIILKEMEDTIQNEKIYAIWECWLDYYRLPPKLTETKLSKEELIGLQKYFFTSQIKLAKKYQLPLIIHNREASNDILEILKNEDYKNFVFHCYSENYDFAQKILEFSPEAMISFSGIVTFNSAKTIQGTAQKIPLKNILIETDCPYLSPVPERGTENYPGKVKYVLKKIQELRWEKDDEVEETIFENSLRFFWLKS
jgi:TatD DNase family protein